MTIGSRDPENPGAVEPPSPSGVRPDRTRFFGTPLLLAVLFASALPAPAEAQVLGPLLEAVREGGSWVRIPVEDGRGTIRMSEVPTMGLEIQGCARVWGGHSGLWEITARDDVADRTLRAELAPDEDVPFVHRTGPRARLSVDVRWSEPRDTTLLLWVGLGPRDPREGCQPPARRE